MVASQDQDVFPGPVALTRTAAAHSVSGALVPIAAAWRLFSRQDLHPTLVKIVEGVGLGNMTMQRDRVELGENGDTMDARVDCSC